HIFEHWHLVRKNVVIEDRAQLLSLAPEWIVLFRIQPGSLGMIERTEAHALKSAILDPMTQVVDDVLIFGIQKPMREDEIRITMQRIVDVGVIPTVISRIDQHRIAQSKILHLLDLIFNWRL